MCNCGKKCRFYCAAIVLLIVLLLVNIKLGSSSRNLEMIKAGGSENRKLLEKIYTNSDYIKEQTQAIDSTIDELKDSTSDTTYTNTDTEEETTQNNDVDVSAFVEGILASAPVRGNKDARFTIIEYTELLCPYCQMHSSNNTINTVIETFPGEVNSVSRHYIIHGQTALELAAAMECVGELNPDVYYDVFEQGFQAYPVDMAGLINIATNAGVNQDSLQACIDAGKYQDAVSEMMNLGYTVFGITGTPGNVIFDRQTGKYQVLPGAYTSEYFVDIINNMKNS